MPRTQIVYPIGQCGHYKSDVGMATYIAAACANRVLVDVPSGTPCQVPTSDNDLTLLARLSRVPINSRVFFYPETNSSKRILVYLKTKDGWGKIVKTRFNRIRPRCPTRYVDYETRVYKADYAHQFDSMGNHRLKHLPSKEVSEWVPDFAPATLHDAVGIYGEPTEYYLNGIAFAGYCKIINL